MEFENSPDASGLQWLPAEQTAGKRHPYLFSQFQPILARSMVPCQDTPAVKHPYSAKVMHSSVYFVFVIQKYLVISFTVAGIDIIPATVTAAGTVRKIVVLLKQVYFLNSCNAILVSWQLSWLTGM